MVACSFEASVAVAAPGGKANANSVPRPGMSPRERLQLHVAAGFRTDPPRKGATVRRHGGRCIHGISWKLTTLRGAATRDGRQAAGTPCAAVTVSGRR